MLLIQRLHKFSVQEKTITFLELFPSHFTFEKVDCGGHWWNPLDDAAGDGIVKHVKNFAVDVFLSTTTKSDIDLKLNNCDSSSSLMVIKQKTFFWLTIHIMHEL